MDYYIIKILIIVGIVYSIWYTIENNQLSFLFEILVKMFIESFKHTTGLLTIVFLIIYCTLSFLNKSLYFHTITIKTLFENPQNISELSYAIGFLCMFILATIIWIDELLFLARTYILQISFENKYVSLIIRTGYFVMILLFNIKILMPLFIYGLISNCGS